MKLGELSDDMGGVWEEWIRTQPTSGTCACGSLDDTTAAAAFYDDSDDPGWADWKNPDRYTIVKTPASNPYKDAFDYLITVLKHHHTRRPGIREAIRKAEEIAEGKLP